ncbi:CheR family methyltransferase [Fuscovulum ytuae]|uniref:protein-glutamate O-methyltransferase n=1 Tax=Fuscovulum ytuae TaxID=3042299 RepID=A0ABY8Q259_9RHOB|nr:protein-glutamate O-methyltransferase CheR [Fuscovulum sp. YMD61]WGV14909.1 protein-glutamate O-methyltransferase CheR [Fuscovulum sp. YMD61]
MTTTDRQGAEAIRGWLSQRCGIHFPEHKIEQLRQRLARVQRDFAMRDLSDIAGRLNSGSSMELQLAVMHAASTNHTYFFREMDVLDAFRIHILPSLAQRDEIRIWSAACAAGDEAYTLAILIAETLGPVALRRTAILGTDISAPVIAEAEAATYPENRLDRVPPDYLARWFEPAEAGRLRVKKEIRDVCTFRQMNLKTRPYPFRKTFQAVFCRNVLYYFERDDQIATLRALHEVTEPGGWLVTSVTENVRDVIAPWTPISNAIFRKEGA